MHWRRQLCTPRQRARASEGCCPAFLQRARTLGFAEFAVFPFEIGQEESPAQNEFQNIQIDGLAEEVIGAGADGMQDIFFSP